MTAYEMAQTILHMRDDELIDVFDELALKDRKSTRLNSSH